ncbi:MAG: hypothetical protein AAGA15_17355 [Pseudomonadota bacterium]
MAVILGIIILAIVIFWMNRTSGLGGPVVRKRVQKSCTWERVDPTETRALKEYRCSACRDVAYGRGENPPASRTCRSQ